MPGRCTPGMTRPLALLIAAGALLALPAGATAKEVSKATICGADGCTTEKDHKAVAAAVEQGGPPGGPPNRGAPFYRVTVHIKGDPQGFKLLVAPELRKLRADGRTWVTMTPAAVSAWRKLFDGVKPFPAARLPDVDPTAPSAPKLTTTGALPPQTYAPALTNPPVTGTSDGTAWGLIAALGAGAIALLAAGAALVTRRRRGDGRAPVLS